MFDNPYNWEEDLDDDDTEWDFIAPPSASHSPGERINRFIWGQGSVPTQWQATMDEIENLPEPREA